MDKVSLTLMDKWILSRLNSTIRDVDDNLSNYHIHRGRPGHHRHGGRPEQLVCAPLP